MYVCMRTLHETVSGEFSNLFNAFVIVYAIVRNNKGMQLFALCNILLFFLFFTV